MKIILSPAPGPDDTTPLTCGSADSPLGRCHIIWSARGIHQLDFHQSYIFHVRSDKIIVTDDQAACVLVAALFSGGLAEIRVCPGGTVFQLMVWRALLDIPAGATASYGAIARAIGRPGAARAVGAACGANPVAWLIPCHRVIRADGSIHGYRWGMDIKRALLAREARPETPHPTH